MDDYGNEDFPLPAEELQRLEEIEGWFFKRGFVVRYDVDVDEDGFGGFLALVMKADERLGEAVAEGAASKQVDAAEEALLDFVVQYGEETRRIVVGDAGEGRDTAHVHKGEAHQSLNVEMSASGEVSPGVEERIDQLAGEFGWSFTFAPEPDGAFRLFVFDREGQTLFKTAVTDTWDDALLEAVSDLHPPSGER